MEKKPEMEQNLWVSMDEGGKICRVEGLLGKRQITYISVQRAENAITIPLG